MTEGCPSVICHLLFVARTLCFCYCLLRWRQDLQQASIARAIVDICRVGGDGACVKAAYADFKVLAKALGDVKLLCPDFA